ncbi:hypothetical protein [Streptomyces caniscabiei]|uniref:Secreted protein n=1 Tax=Streptomyces caniscabiei TaxID=2746961 RepID=A0ABU4MZQ5_9ACTN|nr:hypothetical protein [Streptomyces caniscabiei]MBE4790276.1 hypothetical protein [Streptomyces caniscabiei]MBE4799495.1 hypothetical protein [Streptomyces caniscabiei]MDX3015133.1 hypothetical protein [Streptomyces caniscabiei]MDX3042576.1 hypothetical protein [Streptomyces caniscabiei]
MKRFRRIAATLALATAATTGALLTDNLAPAPAADTAWGSPVATAELTVLDVDTIRVTPLDTAWG